MKGSDKAYFGIWEDPVALADRDAEKDATPEKPGYFEGQAAKAMDAGDAEDFDRQGQAYKAYIGKMRAVSGLHPGQGYDKSRQDPKGWTGPKGKYM